MTVLAFPETCLYHTILVISFLFRDRVFLSFGTSFWPCVFFICITRISLWLAVDLHVLTSLFVDETTPHLALFFGQSGHLPNFLYLQIVLRLVSFARTGFAPLYFDRGVRDLCQTFGLCWFDISISLQSYHIHLFMNSLGDVVFFPNEVLHGAQLHICQL